MLYLIRYSEIGLKGKRKRSQMEDRLVSNVLASFDNSTECRIRREKGRIFAEFPEASDPGRIEDNLSHVFGIKSFSRCQEFDFHALADLTGIAKNFFSDIVSGRRYAVRVRRTGNHAFTSIDAERAIGDALSEFGNGVDLVDPEATAHVEIRDRKSYMFRDQIRGAGGFPLGTQGRMISLVSGGIDSPAAAWMMMKRGCISDIVFCSLAHPIDTAEFARTIMPLIRKWSYGANLSIHIFDGSPLVEMLAGGNGFEHPNVAFKKFLYQLAEKTAHRRHALGIVTGESLGQVSSQTAENLYALDMYVHMPVHRPLIGLDKDEIVDLAKRIGTFPSESLGEFCSIFSENPTIAVDPESLSRDNVPEELFQRILDSEIVVKKADFPEFAGNLKIPEFSSTGKDHAEVLVDLRPESRFKAWHPEGAHNIPVSQIHALPDEFGRDKKYVFYCAKGLMSAYAASRFAAMGIAAVHADENKIRKLYERENKNKK